MAIRTNSYRHMLVIIFCFVILVGCSGSSGSDNGSPAPALTGHEGHNHAPGEEHAIATAGEDPNLTDWCAEHSVPESQCTMCNPSLITRFREAGDWCAAHNLPESHCRLCNPGIVFAQEAHIGESNISLVEDEISVSLNYRTNAAVCATDGALIQFASAATVERAGITVQPVVRATRSEVCEAPAEIVFDETAISALTTSVASLVTRWLVSPGDRVAAGQELAVLESPDIGRLRSDLVTAHAQFQVEQKELDRHMELKERNLISLADWDVQAAEYDQARAQYVGARSRLLSAGLSEADIAEVLQNDDLSNRFMLRAPIEGVIIERKAGIGQLQDAGGTFATIGDPTAMWIEARLTERQMQSVDSGYKLVFSSDGGGIDRAGGVIIWVSPFLDSHTRTGIVRARIIDPHHGLRAGEFGRAQLVKEGLSEISLVHKDAVQWEGCCNVVFVKEAIGRYRPRKVQLVGAQGPYYQVIDGVEPGQEIVVDGAFLLKTELKKSSIGAGCCGLEPVG